MKAARATKAEYNERVRKFVFIIANGGRRADCLRLAKQENWGVNERTCFRYLTKAREELKNDWNIERPQMIADLLSQCSSLQLEARKRGQLHVALGAINTAARLARLLS